MKIPKTYEECNEDDKFVIDELRERYSLSSFRAASESGYRTILKLSPHILLFAFNHKKQTIWNKDLVIKEALKYEKISDWKRNSKNSYSYACRKKIIPECTSHMKNIRKKVIQTMWTDEMIISDSLKYKTLTEWILKSKNSYQMAHKRKITDQIHLFKDLHRTNWDVNFIKIEALKYKTIKEWSVHSNSSYQASRRFGIHEECISHMIDIRSIKALKIKNEIVEFCLDKRRVPSRSSKCKIERNLGEGLRRYSDTDQTFFDKGFKDKIDSIIKDFTK